MVNEEQAAMIQKSINRLNDNVDYAEHVLNNTIKSYSKDLDEVMALIHQDIINTDYPAINTIEKYFVQLSSVLYTMCEKVEKLGIYDSMSKTQAQETYNIKYLEVTNPAEGKKPTVGETQAMAEGAAIYDRTVNDIYSRAYKVLKNKVEAAETMVSTLSKILSHRIQESQMVGQQMERKILNEGNLL